MPGKRNTLSPPEQDRVIDELRAIRQELGSQVAVAEALEVTQQSVSRVLAGFPPGITLAEKIAGYRRKDVDVFLGRKAERTVVYDRPGRTAQWGNLPGWAEAEKEARVKFARRNLPERAWLGARELAGAKRPNVTPEFVYDAAVFWLEHCDDEGG